MGMQHNLLVDNRLAGYYVIDMTFEDACKVADRLLNAGNPAFIVLSKPTDFYVTDTMGGVENDDKLILYMSGYAGIWRSYDIYGSPVAGQG
jgi:hypothetical protein